MSKKHRNTMEENIVNILKLCREKPRTLHYIKDKFNFSNDKLKKVMDDLQKRELLVIYVSLTDKRRTYSINTISKGKQFLLEKGIKY